MDIVFGLLVLCLISLSLAGGLLIYLLDEVRKLKGVTYVSIQGFGEFLTLIARYSTLENPVARLAKLAKLTPMEVEVEIKQHGIIRLMEGIAKTNIENIKCNVPDAKKIFDPIEKQFEE